MRVSSTGKRGHGQLNEGVHVSSLATPAGYGHSRAACSLLRGSLRSGISGRAGPELGQCLGSKVVWFPLTLGGGVRAGRVPCRQDASSSQPQCPGIFQNQTGSRVTAAWCGSQLPTCQQACLHVLVTLQIKCPQSLPSIPEPSSCRLP